MSDHLNRGESGLANEYTELMIIAAMNSWFALLLSSAFGLFILINATHMCERCSRSGDGPGPPQLVRSPTLLPTKPECRSEKEPEGISFTTDQQGERGG